MESKIPRFLIFFPRNPKKSHNIFDIWFIFETFFGFSGNLRIVGNFLPILFDKIPRHGVSLRICIFSCDEKFHKKPNPFIDKNLKHVSGHTFNRIENSRSFFISKIVPGPLGFMWASVGVGVNPGPAVAELIIYMPIMMRNTRSRKNEGLQTLVFPMRLSVDFPFLHNKFPGQPDFDLHITCVRNGYFSRTTARWFHVECRIIFDIALGTSAIKSAIKILTFWIFRTRILAETFVHIDAFRDISDSSKSCFTVAPVHRRGIFAFFLLWVGYKWESWKNLAFMKLAYFEERSKIIFKAIFEIFPTC